MNSDIIVGAFSAVFSLVYVIAAWDLPPAAIGNPMAPKYFPLVVGILATITAIALIVQGVKKGPIASKRKPDQGYQWLIVGLCLCCLVYAGILESLGFLISTPLFLGAMLFLVNGVQGWKANILTAAGFSVSVWYVFEKVFYLSLP